MNLTKTPANNYTVNQSEIQIYSERGSQSLATPIVVDIEPERPYQINNISLFFYGADGKYSSAHKDILVTIRDTDANNIHIIYDEENHNSGYLSVISEHIRLPSNTKIRVFCSAEASITDARLTVDYEII